MEIYRLFDPRSRALKVIKGKAYAGQVYDSLSVTLHIEYADLTFLAPDEDGTAYIPYILFDVTDENGVPLCYGPDSTPAFDGYTFSLPWDVTSRIRRDRLQYQLVFSKTAYDVDDRGVAQIVSDPENILSSMDGLIIKPSIKCRPPNPACAPVLPSTQPTIQAMLDMFSRYGVVVPVDDYIDEGCDRLCLVFRTYKGDHDCVVTLQVPYLSEDGLVPPWFLDMITEWGTENDENIASALLVKSSLDLKVDKSQIVTEWSDEPSDERIPSEKLVKDSLDKKVDLAQIVTEWSDPLSDENIPSERLVKESLDEKTDRVMAIPPWENDVTYSKDSTVIYDGTIYISLIDGNRNNQPDLDNGAWAVIQGGMGSTSDGCFITMVGDGENVEYTVTHNLGTLNLFVTMRTNDSDRRYVEARVRSATLNDITVSFTNPPVENGIIVLLARGDRTNSVYCDTIGNGRDTEYIVTHNLGMYNFFWELRTNDQRREYVDATVTAINPTQARITFEYAVDVDAITVMIAPCIASRWAGRWVHAQMDPSDEWVIDHDLARMVGVHVYTNDGVEMFGEVRQDMRMLDTVTVRFSEPVAGMAVLQ